MRGRVWSVEQPRGMYEKKAPTHIAFGRNRGARLINTNMLTPKNHKHKPADVRSAMRSSSDTTRHMRTHSTLRLQQQLYSVQRTDHTGIDTG